MSAFLLAISANANNFSIQNNGWKIEFFSNEAAPLSIGSIKTITSPSNDTIFTSISGRGLFEWDLGGAFPLDFSISQKDDNRFDYHIDHFITPSGLNIPLSVDLQVFLQNEEISFTTRFTAHDTIRFDEGLSLRMPLDFVTRVDFTGATGDTISYNLYYEIKPQLRYPFCNLIKINSHFRTGSDLYNLFIILRNPLILVPHLYQDHLNLEILISNDPNTTRPEGSGKICSILNPGETLEVSWGIMSPAVKGHNQARPGYNIAVFSAHPQASEQSTYLSFDDIPSFEPGWMAPTDSQNPHIRVSSNLLSFLDLFPDIKFTYLLLTDNIQRLGKWFWREWWPPYQMVVPDSTIIHEGLYSARCKLFDEPGRGAISICPYFAIEPDHHYRIGGYGFLDKRGNSDTYFAIIVTSMPLAEQICAEAFTLIDQEWNYFEISFYSGNSGAVFSNFRFDGNAADLYIDDTFCIDEESGENIIPNPGLEDFIPYIYFDPPERIWPNARSCFRLATEAPDEYKRWLKIIQDGLPEWEYSSQVGVGLHGMHHTPDSTFTQYPAYPKPEFDLYDPYGDSLRMAHIVEDLETIDLDPYKILSFFRFPGHRHTESILKELFRYDCRIIDHGVRLDIENYFGRIYRYNKSLWQTNSIAWHDTPDWYLNANLKLALDGGMFSMMGAHYYFFGSLKEPGAREVTIDLLNWLETDYPYLWWFKGDELACFWDELGAIRSVVQSSYNNYVRLDWEGASTLNETVMILLEDEKREPFACRIDGQYADFEKRKDRVFICLPNLDSGSHNLELYLKHKNASLRNEGEWNLRFSSANTLVVEHLFKESKPLNLYIYDAMGRLITSRHNINVSIGTTNVFFDVSSIPSGSMIVKIKYNNETVVRTLILTK